MASLCPDRLIKDKTGAQDGIDCRRLMVKHLAEASTKNTESGKWPHGGALPGFFVPVAADQNPALPLGRLIILSLQFHGRDF